jgi:L-fucono-1,5-lactonase
MYRIDAHQHCWDVTQAFPAKGSSWILGAISYAWERAGLPQLARSFLPADLAPHLEAAGIQRTVLVNVLENIAETRWMLDLADANLSIGGVVGWVNLAQPIEGVRRDLATVRHARLVGIRHLVQFEQEEHWLLRPDVVAGLKLLAAEGLAYDLLVHPGQLADVPALSDRVPELRMVIDHLAKPFIKDGIVEPWASDMRAAARNPQLFCKLSGMVTEADHRQWTPKDLRPYIEKVLDAFGVDRVMFGSDWPVCTLAAGYAQVYGALAQNLVDIFGSVPQHAQEAIFGGNAARFYRIDAHD